MTTSTQPVPVSARPSDAGPPASRAAGLELLGEFQGSGAQQAPCLVRRADGQVLQLSPLVYAVLEALDGRRGPRSVAEAVQRSTGRELDDDGVAFLLERKLAPLGLLEVEGAAPPPRANPLLALQARTPLLRPGATAVVAAAFQPLFRAPVVLAAVVALALLDAWLFALHGLEQAVLAVAADPALTLAVLVTTLLASTFHEFGHAAACRYSGGRPGAIGVGMYLVFPSFYTDVTDSYRLGRAGRLRTDLGGLYFHALSVLVLGGAYAATGAEWLLLAVVLIQLEMLQQLLPLVRFDGYHVLADLVGVPDLFARIGPVLRHALHRGGARDPRVVGLKRWVRVTVTVWVAVVVPFLAVSLSLLVWHLPRTASTIGASCVELVSNSARALDEGQLSRAASEGLNALLLALTLAGVLYVVLVIARQLGGIALRWSAPSSVRRVGVLAVASVVLVGLLTSWVVTGQFTSW
jgi:putative peptide zinc metalloprotease protein